MRQHSAIVLCALAIGVFGCSAPPGETMDAVTEAPAIVDHTQLAALVPEADAWTRGPVASTAVDEPAPRAQVETSYSRGAARIDLELIDTAGLPEYIEATASIAGTEYSRTSANGFTRGAMLSGFPAIESWNHVDRLGEITLLVAGRFIVHAAGADLDDLETLQGFVQAVDLAALARLGSEPPPGIERPKFRF